MIDSSAIVEGITQFGNLLLLVAQVVTVLIGPFFIIELVKKYRDATTNKDIPIFCSIILVMILYGVCTLDLVIQIMKKL